MTELVNTFQRVTSSERREVLAEADGVLQEFKTFMEQTFPNASSLYEGAKILFDEVHQKRLHHEKDEVVVAVFEQQREKWSTLLEGAQKIRDEIKEKYKEVTSLEDRVKKARGTGPSLAVLGFPTPSQQMARYVYDKQLKYAFHDAQSEVAMMTGYPDGMLIQIRLLHDHAAKLATPGESTPVKLHINVTDEAEATLEEFKVFMKEAYPKASALYERAKWLWQDVHDLRAKKAPDAEVAKVLADQEETWKRLDKNAAILRDAVEKEFAKVMEAEDKVKKARGVYPNVAALGFPTPAQRIARHMYAKSFKYAFHDAKDEYAGMCGFPDGMLVKIDQVHKYTLQTAGNVGHAEQSPRAAE